MMVRYINPRLTYTRRERWKPTVIAHTEKIACMRGEVTQ